MNKQTLAIFGGTFDPIHNGHLNTSLSIQNSFQFERFCFMPCNIPVLKNQARATNAQRLTMLELALKPYPQFEIDCRELNSTLPSYSVTSLTSIRKEQPEACITFIMGFDSLLTLPFWHQWEHLLDLAHLLVINRLDYAHQVLPQPVQRLLKTHQTQSKTDLLHQTAGHILFFDAGLYEISSTAVREALKLGQLMGHELPNGVYDFIVEKGLYQ